MNKIFTSDKEPEWICSSCHFFYGSNTVFKNSFKMCQCDICELVKDCVSICRFGGINWQKATDDNKDWTEQCYSEKDAINPDHYKSGSMESIEVIEAFDLGFNLGNVVKYVLRAGKKDDKKQDLLKCVWYIEREIKNIK